MGDIQRYEELHTMIWPEACLILILPHTILQSQNTVPKRESRIIYEAAYIFGPIHERIKRQVR
jgi:hypothetical protein